MIVSILLVPTIAYLFYDSWIGILPGLLSGLLYFREWKKEKEKKEKRQLLLEFKGLLTAVRAAVTAG